ISLGKGDTEHDAEVYWYHNDVSGMPRELTGAGGEIAWRAEYRAWGNTLRVEHIETRDGEPVYQPLRYQGQYFDAETGLHYNRFRYYDPDAGRFISQDPIGLAGGINLYQYAPNPLVWVDPLGLNPKCRKTNKQYDKASDLPVVKPNTKEWEEAVAALRKDGRGDIRVKNAADAKKLLKEARGNMDARKMYSYKKKKYSKGYEFHKPQHGSKPGGWEKGEVSVGNDLPHIKWRDGANDQGHIFFED
ncbi:RHS repeat-associated core domain-containing protein, partial [Cronobacter malonaticus]